MEYSTESVRDATKHNTLRKAEIPIARQEGTTRGYVVNTCSFSTLMTIQYPSLSDLQD